MLSHYPQQCISAMLQAFSVASMSKARRRKVGAMIFREISTGYFQPLSNGVNGTRPGECNVCEDMDGSTRKGVIHAEQNCFIKMLREGIATKGCTVVVTLVPCLGCCDRILDAGIREVVYCEGKTDPQDTHASVDYLSKRGVTVHQITKEQVAELSQSITNSLLHQEKFLGEELSDGYDALVNTVAELEADTLKSRAILIHKAVSKELDAGELLIQIRNIQDWSDFLKWYEKVYDLVKRRGLSGIDENADCYEIYKLLSR